MSAAEPRLRGRRVVVTRPRTRAEALCFLLEDEGAEVVEAPVLELTAPDDARPLAAAAESLQRYAWVVFASPTAVEALVEAAREAGTRDRLARLKVAVVGPATAKAARAHGLEVACEAVESTGPGLFEALQPRLLAGDEVLLPTAQAGRTELFEALLEAGVAVTRVAAYKAEARGLDPALLLELKAQPPDAVIFGSPRTAEGFVECAGKALVAASRLVAIGPTTAGVLEALGFAPAAVAERPTPEALLEATVRAVRGAG